jgi:hypothetical protein
MSFFNAKARAPMETAGNIRSERNWINHFGRCVVLAKQNGEFTESFLLTPELAKYLLEECNPKNRPIRQAHVEQLSIDIKNGRFQHNGEAVSKEGLLNDGQHRCIAVVRTGIAIKTQMGFGFPRESRLTANQAAIKRSGDYISLMKISNGNNVADVGTLIWQYEEHGRVSNHAYLRPTKDQLNMFVADRHELILSSIAAVPKAGCSLVGGLGVLAFCHYVFSNKHREKADYFISKIVNGDNLSQRDPIYACRQRLLNRESRRIVSEKAELLFRAWRAYIDGRDLRKISTNGVLPPLDYSARNQ